MDDVPEKPVADYAMPEIKLASAWQPFTPRGVAAFAPARPSRVFVLKLSVALLATAAVIWFLKTNYFPSISEAIKNLPDEAALQNGALTNVVSGILTQRKFLSTLIEMEETGRAGQTSDVQLELHRNYFQICSLLGCAQFDYPKENISVGRSTSEPWWGARQPVIWIICSATILAGLWLVWEILAILYAPLAKLIAYFLNRELSWRGSWRLAFAAQMTGALLLSFGVILYGLQVFDLIGFLFFFGSHFVVAWVYVFSAPFFLPRVLFTTPTNPFFSN